MSLCKTVCAGLSLGLIVVLLLVVLVYIDNTMMSCLYILLTSIYVYYNCVSFEKKNKQIEKQINELELNTTFSEYK